MFNNPFSMVVAIVLICAIAGVLRARFKAQHGIYEDEKGKDIRFHDPEADRLRSEVKQLKDRIAVLERVITDERGPRELDREIEKLRDR
ncbi:hypothetical protein [Novosphingopyxis sp.]|uniref:hypothetical protein n=1 Tax=Novosphingopyxis sp. TaxID=2709690 RepID=UPI003B5B07BD